MSKNVASKITDDFKERFETEYKPKVLEFLKNIIADRADQGMVWGGLHPYQEGLCKNYSLNEFFQSSTWEELGITSLEFQYCMGKFGLEFKYNEGNEYVGEYVSVNYMVYEPSYSELREAGFACLDLSAEIMLGIAPDPIVKDLCRDLERLVKNGDENELKKFADRLRSNI